MSIGEVMNIMTKDRICILLPTFHNEDTIVDVVRRCLVFTKDIIVVIDGEPEQTENLIVESKLHVNLISYKKNAGKGAALKRGFAEAIRKGFHYAITLDTDGQHYPEDIPQFIECHRLHPEAFISGCRTLPIDKMAEGSTFANRLSNFWFHFQTGLKLTDTQCGYRLYPLEELNSNWIITSRYESELEMLVYSAWHGTEIIEVPIKVYYPPAEERNSHFRPFRDFMRITLLNIILTVVAVVYYLSLRLIRKHRL